MRLFLIICTLCASFVHAQTTDLAITVETQDATGVAVSSAHIYEEYQYLVTVSNTGAAVVAANVNITIDHEVDILTVNSQNPNGNAQAPVLYDVTNNTITGTTLAFPTNSSFEILIEVRAPLMFLGGVFINAIVQPPSGTTDTAPITNQAVSSITITDVDIDFSINCVQTNPTAGTGITAWGDSVTYAFTITNNSSIAYPINQFRASLANVNQLFGSAVFEVLSVTCVGSTGGVSCPTIGPPTAGQLALGSIGYLHDDMIVFPAGSSLTFEIEYEFNEGDCANQAQPVQARHDIDLFLSHDNVSPSTCNTTITPLLTTALCQCTDIQSTITRITQPSGQITSYSDNVTYQATLTNDGPVAAPVRWLFYSLDPTISIDIQSVTCLSAIGPGASCTDVSPMLQGNGWQATVASMEPGTTYTFETVLKFVEPIACTEVEFTYQGPIRSWGFIDSSSTAVVECYAPDNLEQDVVSLLPSVLCEEDEPALGVTITKEQFDPIPTIGLESSPAPWGPTTYEIVLTNDNSEDRIVELVDRIIPGTAPTPSVFGTLVSVTCSGTTGNASCPSFDPILVNGMPPSISSGDVWTAELGTGFILPANSSITITCVIDWQPPCTTEVLRTTNFVQATVIDPLNPGVSNTTQSSSKIFFTPCVDLIVQTFPSVAALGPNEPFEWVVDIANSNASSTASDVSYEGFLDPAFTISGIPTCSVTAGIGSCPSSFDLNGTNLQAIIPTLEPGASIQIRIPTISPNQGGSFTSSARATPNPQNNGEITPETNFSTANVFIVTTTLTKEFLPPVINTDGISLLQFKIENSNTLPMQTGVQFTDQLPTGVVLAGVPQWVDQNGASGNLIGAMGDDAVGVQDLTIPSGVAEITFMVPVTSSLSGFYVNDSTNITDTENVGTAQVLASLEVVPFVDLAITKTVNNSNPRENETFTFTITITNNSDVPATDVLVEEIFPAGLEYVSHETLEGVYDSNTELWQVGTMEINTTATLTIIATAAVDGVLNNQVIVTSSLAYPDRDTSNNTASAQVQLYCIQTYQGFSPNGDGINDRFVVDCLDQYTNSEMSIYSRHGNMIYEMEEDKGGWDGIPNRGVEHTAGSVVPPGTYFYVIRLNDGSDPITGWFYCNY